MALPGDTVTAGIPRTLQFAGISRTPSEGLPLSRREARNSRMAKRLQALIVEDSEIDAELLLLELRRGGYDVVPRRVETAPEMRTALEEGGWDIVLSDYSLPTFSALAALEVLKGSGLDIPMIIISG